MNIFQQKWLWLRLLGLSRTRNGKGTIIKKFRNILSVAVLFVSFHLLRAQTTNTESIVQITAEAEGLSQVPLESVPIVGGTFWVVSQNGMIPPFPMLPVSLANSPIYDMGDGVSFLVDGTAGQVIGSVDALGNSVANLIEQMQTTRMMRSSARMFGMDVPTPGDGGGGDYGGEDTNFYSSPLIIDTNLLWLEITNVSNGFSCYNLHNATNFVYAIMTTPDLTQPFAVESELWPTDTNCQPFTLATLGRNPLFLKAMDWTGVESNTNGIPDWWEWNYFGTVTLLATNLDGQGRTFLYDYQHDIDPNIISFTLSYTNEYANSYGASVQLNIQGGTPFYYAVLVDDTNNTDANWISYTSTNIIANLGAVEGWHQVSVGLRGLPSNASQTWQSTRLKLDLSPPLLVITNPATGTVIQPIIQLQGYCPESLASLSYDLTNATGLVTNQQAIILGQTYDTNTLEFTTNYFQCFDVPLTNGVNTITLHAMDWAGNVTTTNFSCTLDYSNATTPPSVQLAWPQAGTKISGNSFTWRGKVSDPTAQVIAQIVDTNGVTNSVSGRVGRDGDFLVRDIPLSGGTNNLTLTVTDAAGNTNVTTIPVIQSSLVLTITSASLGGAVTGTISDTNYTVWVNGVKATNNMDGTWTSPHPHLTLAAPAVQVRAIPNSDNSGNGGGQ